MKKGIVFLLIIMIICVGSLFFSATVWKNKIQKASEISPGKTVVSKEDLSGSKDSKLEDEDFQLLLENSLSKTVIPEVKDLFMNRFSKNEEVKILLIGSEPMKPVSENFSKKIRDTFQDRVTVDEVTSDLTSTDFVNQEMNEIDWSKEYDIVLYESFTLKNNGLVVIEQEHEDLLSVQAKALESNEQTIVYVTPPHPIYKPNYYQTQITSLENFTRDRDILYINHWPDWPPTDSDEILNYVDEDNVMTDKGIDVWSDALIHTFLK
ncbi:hypothetical protein M3197_02300 [Sporosarcina aquimarina]|uniref:hypothetical protein n=1 Tax=Sporosarcina aquimarina TaxID=114975 RepID=UPI00203D5096|nr:hypothetical protein [Sporosarcina aquimarina]MCM3756309.1 hypothetical protein [Sporosarcina aquimarina]